MVEYIENIAFSYLLHCVYYLQGLLLSAWLTNACSLHKPQSYNTVIMRKHHCKTIWKADNTVQKHNWVKIID